MKGMLIAVIFGLVSCSSFKAERVDAAKSDEKALTITDEWLQKDTEQVIGEVLKQLDDHKGYRRWVSALGHQPKLFVGEVKNLTSEAYYPINDLNDEFLNALSQSGDYVLVDAASREHLLKEIKYQNDGMVDPSSAKKVGKAAAADLMIFGNVYMKPETREGKTIKQYSVNIYLTDLEKGVEVARTRAKLSKYSAQKGAGW